MIVNYYEILGIESNAIEEQIKKAYRINAIKYHPDKNFGDTSFIEKFLIIKEAYDNLIDPDKRKIYDIKYNQNFSEIRNESKQQQEKQEKQEKEQTEREKKQEKFRYNPYEHFFSDYDRKLQETPQFNPNFDVWGDQLIEGSMFFKLPKKIGKIICGFSDYFTEIKPVTNKQKLKYRLIATIIGLVMGTIIYLFASLSNPIWIGFWYIIPILILVWLVNSANEFKYTNYFIGVNGFAQYVCKDSIENIIIDNEINFNEMTDLYVYHREVRTNYNYNNTDFLYVCFNRETGGIIFSQTGEFDKNTYKKEKDPRDLINFFDAVERHWTIYLLDNLEKRLQQKGYISFCLYSHEKNIYEEYIKLGIGYITFIKSQKQEFIYKFDEIKKMYIKENELHIQHKNFERTLYFFKSGNEDVIPMLTLCNRQFFYTAIELLLGYSIR
jgi:curved DNA-binding protein CbpA